MNRHVQRPARLGPQILQAIIIGIGTFWVFSPAFRGGWLWDDNVLITENPFMDDPSGLWKIWFSPGTFSDYYPLTFSLQRLEWFWWGNNTLGYHLVNVALHIVSTFLVWRLLSKLGLRLAWLGGLIFAIHPVQVESVAWIAELKNALSLPPFLWAMCAWIDFDRQGKRQDYFSALGLFFVALLCKITVIMFPVIILLYAWWRRGKIRWLDVGLSAPFFAVSLAAGLLVILTGVWEHTFNHVPPEFMPPGGILGRFVLAGLELAFYFSKCVLPVGLLPVYPKWAVDPSAPLQYLPWLALIGPAVWFGMKRQTWGKHALLGLGFFVINLLPCPGFIPSSNMGYAWVMDHFLYLPIIGLIGLTVAALDALPENPPMVLQVGRAVFIALTVIFFAVGSHAYAKLYESSMRLWSYTQQYNPTSWMVHLGLGEALMRAGQSSDAVVEFETAQQLFPDYVGIHYDLGLALENAGRVPEAIDQYEKVAAANPDYHGISDILSAALIKAHRTSDATTQLEKLLQRDPQDVNAHVSLGNIYVNAGRLPEALAQFQQASTLDPTSGELHYFLGNLFLQVNRLPEALAQFQQAAQIIPKDLNVLSNLGVTLARLGRLPEAAAQFDRMLQVDPNSAEAHNNLGGLYLMAGSPEKAAEQYQMALRINPGFTQAQENLAHAKAAEQAHLKAPAK